MSSASSESPRPLNPGDVLPPVEPPSAGFIVKLFLIPAVIVGIVILILGAIYWVQQSGEDVNQYVDALERNDEGRWQAAVNLANSLNRTGNEHYRSDPALLKRIAGVFEKELDAGSMEDQSLKLRYFLARVLGEMQLPEALPPLVKGVRTKRDLLERDVRMGAMQGIARLIPNISAAKPQHDAALKAALEEAAAETDDPVIRYHAAYTLAVLEGDEFLPLLKRMLEDANIDVRANAAVGLARHGDAACVPELAKMIDPIELSDQISKIDEKEREYKKTTLLSNGFAAAKVLHEKAPRADVTPIVRALDQLLLTNPVTPIRLAAEDVRRELLAGPKTAPLPSATPSTTPAATSVPAATATP